MESLSQRDILRFPDQGVGEVWTDITGGPLRGSLTGREQLGEARGEVQVPPEVRLVELRVAREVQDLSFLADLHPLSLTYLGLEGPGLDDRTLGHVAQLTGLRELFLCSSTVTRRGLARLRPLHQLQSLSLFDLSLGDEVFEPVSQLGGLESLNLRGMTLTGEGLPTLAVLPRLRVLALDACALDPAGLQGLTWLAGELSLRQGSLQPGALRHLEGLTRVTTLRLDGSGPFSLNEVRQLLRSLPGLRNLTLEDRYFRGPRQDLGPATSLLVDWEPYAPALVDPAWQPTTPQERPSRLELPDPTAPPPSAALLRDGVAPAASEQAEVGRGLLLPADSAIWACWSWTRDHILALVDRWLSEDLLALSRGLARAMAALPPTPGRRLALALVEVGGELSAANSLYPAVVELRQLLSSWPVERKLTLHGTEYINWPGSEHVERWRELMSTHEEVFEEVGIRRCWPTDRHEVLGQLDDYLRRHQGTSCDSYRVLEPRVALEQECIQRGHAATSPLLGRELDYAQLAQVEAQTHRRRKFFQALAWYDQACLELSLPVQAEAARALSAELEQEQLRPLWERLVGCLSLLGDRTARPNERFHLLGRRDPEATGHGQWWWRRMLAPLDEPGWAPLEGWRRQEPDYRVLPRPDRPLPELESCVVSDRHEAYLEPLPRLYSGLAGWVSWVVRGLEALGLHRVLENWPLEEGTPQRLCEVACAELSGRYLSVEEHRFLLEINDRVKVPEWEIVEVLCPRPDGTWWPACTPRWPEPQERRGGPDS